MSTQNWTDVNGIKVNNEVLADLQAKGFVIIMGEDGYPWVAYLPRVCLSCGLTHCGHPRAPRRWMWLHHFAWDFYAARGLRPERKEGDVIHHQRGDKLDARIKRLGRGNPTSHARAHNAKKRLHSPRERHDLGGLRYRPPQPARVVDRPELVGLPAPVAKRSSRNCRFSSSRCAMRSSAVSSSASSFAMRASLGSSSATGGGVSRRGHHRRAPSCPPSAARQSLQAATNR